MRIKQAHGGNLSQLRRQLELPELVHDFSVNTHPFGPPDEAMAAASSALSRSADYPDTDAAELLAALSDYHRLPADYLIAGNGATELIDVIPRALSAQTGLSSGTGLVVAPAFGEYGAAMERAGGRVMTVRRSSLNQFPTRAVVDALSAYRPNLVWLCSPNNPTGERLSDPDLHAVLAAAHKSGTVVVLDESFVEYDEHGTRIALVNEHANLLVLRGFTKFYALAGLRVGYLAGNPQMIARLSAALPPWRVNRPAAAAAIACLGLDGYENTERARLAALKKEMASELTTMGLAPLPSHASYLLCRLPEGCDPDTLFIGMAQAGFLIRHGGSFGLDRFIRLRVHRPELNRALLDTLPEQVRRATGLSAIAGGIVG
jgi:threonine-phosphate decarboxylase